VFIDCDSIGLRGHQGDKKDADSVSRVAVVLDAHQAGVIEVCAHRGLRLKNMGYMGHFFHSFINFIFLCRAESSKNDPYDPYLFQLRVSFHLFMDEYIKLSCISIRSRIRLRFSRDIECARNNHMRCSSIFHRLGKLHCHLPSVACVSSEPSNRCIAFLSTSLCVAAIKNRNQQNRYRLIPASPYRYRL